MMRQKVAKWFWLATSKCMNSLTPMRDNFCLHGPSPLRDVHYTLVVSSNTKECNVVVNGQESVTCQLHTGCTRTIKNNSTFSVDPFWV